MSISYYSSGILFFIGTFILFFTGTFIMNEYKPSIILMNNNEQNVRNKTKPQEKNPI